MSRSGSKGLSTRTKPSVAGVDALYANALPATRSGPLYAAFPYPTKISPEAVALFIAAHTKPGDTIFDGFAGSGNTGLAALICENPSNELRNAATHLGLAAEWGARNAVLYELGALGAFVSGILTHPPAPRAFNQAAVGILAEAERDDGWMYGASGPKGEGGTLRYLIWSDVLRCPSCDQIVTLWDASVSRDPARIAERFVCPGCSCEVSTDSVRRVTCEVWDNVLNIRHTTRLREPAWVYGTTGARNWSRPVTSADIELSERITQLPVPDAVPRVAIPWGDLYRRGYHQGVSHVHHFYTRRNLIVFGKLWERTGQFESELRDALRFWLLSYNASHATIMTRVVAKRGQKDLVVTSGQPGVLYVSGLPVEKNLLSGLRRKLATITRAFETISSCRGRVEVLQRSSCQVHLPDKSIDYVFTDPPFGGNIPYAEVNFLNEAWLDRHTDRAEEAIVSRAQEKTVAQYRALLTGALSEAHRILKPTGKATLVFHSATADIWNALQSAYTDAGFGVESVGVLDKTQASFKQVTTKGFVRGDPLILLRKRPASAGQLSGGFLRVTDELRRAAKVAADPAERTPQRLYSRFISHYLSNHLPVPLDAETFYRLNAQQHFLEAMGGAGD